MPTSGTARPVVPWGTVPNWYHGSRMIWLKRDPLDVAASYRTTWGVKTQLGAKTLAFDPKTKKIFLTANEVTETPATEPGKRPTRTTKPDSFVVLVVAK